MVSPVALALSAKELWAAVAGKRPAIWVDGDLITSDRFSKPRSDLKSVRAERDRPRYGIWDEEFVVFQFRDGSVVRMFAKRLFETPDEIVDASLALTR